VGIQKAKEDLLKDMRNMDKKKFKACSLICYYDFDANTVEIVNVGQARQTIQEWEKAGRNISDL
jgi:hypothetical protein